MTRKKPVPIADAYPQLAARSGAGARAAERMTSVSLPEYMHARLGYLRSTSKKSLKALILDALEQTYPGDPHEPSLPLHRTPTAPGAATTTAAAAAPAAPAAGTPLRPDPDPRTGRAGEDAEPGRDDPGYIDVPLLH